MSVKLIILIAFFCALVVVFVARIKKRDTKIKSVGTTVDKKGIGNWFKNGNIKYFFPVITPLLVYTAILISFSILLPDLWQKYWIRQEFFWISQVYLVAMVILGRLEGFWLKWMPRIVFSVILFAYIQKEWPQPENDGNDSNIVAKTDATARDSNTLNVVAPIGKWSEVIKAKNGYNWRWYQDDTNYKNVCSLIKVRINGNETVEEYYLPDGTRTGSCFSTTTYFVEFQSKEAWPVDMVVKFVK